MYLQGERIIVLKHIENDIYMGYCEGVIGSFSAENVHFVELDPRVLESLDADIEYAESIPYRQSGSSFGTDTEDSRYRRDHYTRSSVQSFSSVSENYSHKQAWISKPSFESIGSVSTNSYSPFQNSHISSQNYGEERGDSSFSNYNEDYDPYDTSAFNVDYSDEDVVEDTPKSISRPPPMPTKQRQSLSNGATTTTTTTKPPSTDEYGFVTKGPVARSQPSAKTMREYRENEIKWLSIVSRMDAGTVKKDAKLKKLVRNGIPASVRAKVWQFLAGSNDYRKPNQLQSLLSRPELEIYKVIDRDIERCYPTHIQFMVKDGQGQQDLRSILRAYSQYNQELEYCQGMGRLVGLMLMQMTIEDSFLLLVATIDRYMNGYFTPTLSQLRIDANIIGQLLKDHNPKLAQHLENNDVMPIMYIAQWFLTAFTMTLPWETVLRVWDVFYFEGIKVFYRISLAILEVCKDHLLHSCPTNSELLAFLLHIPHSYLEPNNLLDVAFKLHLSKTDIKKYAKKASTIDASTSGLPIEYGIKNLQVGSSVSFHGHLGLKGLSGRINRKASSTNLHSDSY
ncbi:rab-GTPase-TBC domain-containing protein [Pilobolus umbonatus]|nr:rab-GTPase-TBC domain-containing protein [Pilobolus umbonatus]